jgi:hypothetical protein
MLNGYGEGMEQSHNLACIYQHSDAPSLCVNMVASCRGLINVPMPMMILTISLYHSYSNVSGLFSFRSSTRRR